MTFSDMSMVVCDHTRKVWDFFLLLTVCNTVVVSLHGHQDKMDPSGYVHDDSFAEAPHFSSSLPPDLLPHTEATPSVHVQNSQRSSMRSLLQKHKKKLRGMLSPRARSPTAPRQRLENEGCSSGEEEEDRDATDTDTSMLSENTLKTKYEAESPDELALVQAACTYGCRLLHHTPSCVTLWLPREGEVTIRVLHTLHFDSERKRMSVIVQHPATGQLVLYCKGADSAILPNLRCYAADDEHSLNIVKETEWFLTQYAKDGLRTLCMAKKELSHKEYESWLIQHEEAESALEHREKKLHLSASRIENNLELLGVTGIEDRLQTGVPETISSLQAAGMRVWVLTGDKQETALNIAHSCQLISFDQEIIILNAKNKQMAQDLLDSKVEYLDILSRRAEEHSGSQNEDVKEHGELALVIDGKTFGYIQQEKSSRENFLKVAQQCRSVLCCRATPAQKALMVKLVQEKLKKLTLAIGDGANDVSMIQTADIGIGISGKEGMQAVMASDFSLPRFCFLRRLLLVHGHWCYERLARMTLYMFFKNTVFVLLLMWFQLYSGFSGGAQTDDINLILFNLVYTSLPPIFLGIFDKDVPDSLLLSQPWLYKEGQKNKAYKKHSYFLCILDATWQSLVQFFVPYFAYADSDVGIWDFGLTSVGGCVFATLLHLCIETRCWNIFHFAVIVISLLLFFGVNLVFSVLVRTGSPPANPYWVYVHSLGTSAFWLVCLLTVVVALAPRFLIRSLEGTFYPSAAVRSRQSISTSQTRSPNHVGSSAVFVTWASSNVRQRDFEQLREEESYRGLRL